MVLEDFVQQEMQSIKNTITCNVNFAQCKTIANRLSATAILQVHIVKTLSMHALSRLPSR